MTLRRGTAFAPSDLVCFWCKEPAPETPYRSPIPEVAGGRFVVCGPDCPEKPSGALVLTDWRAS